MENITDYSVRVWDKDVFINSDGISLWLCDNGEGLQCNYKEDSERYNEILSLCKEIKEKFLRLNELVK